MYLAQERSFSIAFAIEFKEHVLAFTSLDNLFQVIAKFLSWCEF